MRWPPTAGGAPGRRTPPTAPTCTATSPRRRPTAPSTPTPGRPGGGGVWMTPAYDKALNMIYVAVGNPSPDLDGGIRPGDNLYTDCVVAIDATTGKTKWYYQTVPHDVWDLDAVSPPVVTTIGGKKVVVHAGKTALGVRARRRDRQAGPPDRQLHPAGEHVRPAERRGHPDAAGRQRRLGVVADRGRSTAQLRLRRRPAPADELHHPHRALREGPAVARLGLRRDPGRGAVRHSTPPSTWPPARSPGRTRCRSR